MRGEEELLTPAATERRLTWSPPPHLAGQPPCPPTATFLVQWPGHGTILQVHFFLDLIFWEGKLVPAFCQWSFAVKDMGPFPQGEGRRRLGPGFSSRQTSRTLPWGGSCMMPARLSEPYANHGIREVMASALHHPGVSFYFWPLSSPLTPNRP